MSEKEVASIPFFVHEATVERLERINKRWFIMALVVFILFVLTNAGWIVYESQFTTEEYSVELTQDSADGGTNTYVGNSIRFVGGDEYGEADN